MKTIVVCQLVSSFYSIRQHVSKHNPAWGTCFLYDFCTRTVKYVWIFRVVTCIVGHSNRRALAHRLNPQMTFISEVMTPNPTMVRMDDDAMTCLGIMVERRFRHLPVSFLHLCHDITLNALICSLTLNSVLLVERLELSQACRVVQITLLGAR